MNERLFLESEVRDYRRTMSRRGWAPLVIVGAGIVAALVSWRVAQAWHTQAPPPVTAVQAPAPSNPTPPPAVPAVAVKPAPTPAVAKKPRPSHARARLKDLPRLPDDS